MAVISKMVVAIGLDVVLMLGIVASLGLTYSVVIIITNMKMFRPTPRGNRVSRNIPVFNGG